MRMVILYALCSVLASNSSDAAPSKAIKADRANNSFVTNQPWKTISEAENTIPTGSTTKQVIANLGDRYAKQNGSWYIYKGRDVGLKNDLFLYFQESFLAYWSWTEAKQRLPDLPSGLTKDKVKKLLGEPVRVVSGATWTYSSNGDPIARAYIYFREGKVVKVSSFWAPHCK